MALRLSDEDEATVKMLRSKARALRGAQTVIGSGICRERAEAALSEAAAILEDAARNCRMLPSIPSVREDLLG
jgi:hypothetical protein